MHTHEGELGCRSHWLCPASGEDLAAIPPIPLPLPQQVAGSCRPPVQHPPMSQVLGLLLTCFIHIITEQVGLQPQGLCSGFLGISLHNCTPVLPHLTTPLHRSFVTSFDGFVEHMNSLETSLIGGMVLRWTFSPPTLGTTWNLGTPTILASGISTNGSAAAVSGGNCGPGGKHTLNMHYCPRDAALASACSP